MKISRMEHENDINQMLRLFVAVDMPQDVVDEIQHIQKHFQHKDLFKGKYTPSNGAHITLKFLGNVKTDQVSQLDAALKNIKVSAMQASTSNLDVFFVRHMIRILFLNIECQQLTILAQQIDEALAAWCPPDGRPFVSHTTLARVKVVENSERLVAEINQFRVTKINFIIDHFTLKQSVLSVKGPIYTDIARYALL